MASSCNNNANINIIEKVLQNCYTDLVEELNCKTLLYILHRAACLNAEEMNEAEIIPIREEQNRKLLQILSTKDNNTLELMMNYFGNDETYRHLYGILREAKYKVQSELGITETRQRNETSRISPRKWWPELKALPDSFVERYKLEGNEEIPIADYIHKQFSSNQNESTTASISNQRHCRQYSVVGMAGVGKSTIAKWYANKYQDEYTRIIWIEVGGSAQTLLMSFQGLAETINNEKRVQPREECIEEVVEEVYDQLKRISCLFIFENAESFDGQNMLKDILPKNILHDSLITSRFKVWSWIEHEQEFEQVPTFGLGTFTSSESTLFLTKSLGEALPAAEELGKELRYLPLALQIATSTIKSKASKYTVSSYLERIREEKHHVVERKAIAEYERSVCAVLLLAIQQIEQDENIDKEFKELCKTILNIAAYCLPHEIDSQLFAGIPNVNRYKIHNVIQYLEIYSLVSQFGHDGVNATSIHRHLQAALRNMIQIDPAKMTNIVGLAFKCVESDFGTFAGHASNAWEIVKEYDFIVKAYSQFPLKLLSPNLGYIDIKTIESLFQSYRRVFSEVDVPLVALQLISVYNPVQRYGKYNEKYETQAVTLITSLRNSDNPNPLKQQLLVHAKLLLAYIHYTFNDVYSKQTILDLCISVSDALQVMDFYNGSIDGFIIPYCSLKETHRQKCTLPFRIAITLDYVYILCITGQVELAFKIVWNVYATKTVGSSLNFPYLCHIYKLICDRQLVLLIRTNLIEDFVRECYEGVQKYIEQAQAWTPSTCCGINAHRTIFDIIFAHLKTCIAHSKLENAKKAHSSIICYTRKWERFEEERISIMYFGRCHRLLQEFEFRGELLEKFELCQIIWHGWITLFEHSGKSKQVRLDMFPSLCSLYAYYNQALITKAQLQEALAVGKDMYQIVHSLINGNDEDLSKCVLRMKKYDFDHLVLYKLMADASDEDCVILEELYRLNLSTYLEILEKAKSSDKYANFVNHDLIYTYDAAICMDTILHEFEHVINLTQVVMSKVVEINYHRNLFGSFIRKIARSTLPFLQLMGEDTKINRILEIISKGLLREEIIGVLHLDK